MAVNNTKHQAKQKKLNFDKKARNWERKNITGQKDLPKHTSASNYNLLSHLLTVLLKSSPRYQQHLKSLSYHYPAGAAGSDAPNEKFQYIPKIKNLINFCPYKLNSQLEKPTWNQFPPNDDDAPNKISET